MMAFPEHKQTFQPNLVCCMSAIASCDLLVAYVPCRPCPALDCLAHSLLLFLICVRIVCVHCTQSMGVHYTQNIYCTMLCALWFCLLVSPPSLSFIFLVSL